MLKPPETQTFWEFFKEPFDDLILRILLFAAVLDLVVDMWENWKTGWVDGAAIFFTVFLVAIVTAVNNYDKQKKFLELYITSETTEIVVIRNSEPRKMKNTEILVGDIIVLEYGVVVPADGILLEGDGLKADESDFTGESKPCSKMPALWPNADTSQTYLLSGSRIVEGAGKMIVLAIASNTYSSRLSELSKEEKPSATPLQQRLEVIAEWIGRFGMVSAAIVFITLNIFNFITFFFYKETLKYDWSGLAHGFFNSVIISTAIIVVAVPEGLPLAVTISLAYSISKMQADNILVKNLFSNSELNGTW